MESAAPASQFDLTRSGETFIFPIDQAATDKPQTWMHPVAEAGAYQLGMAWVEPLSGGEVKVTIKADAKLVRFLKARPGLAPQRLDTRIEKLAAGDEITVAATPKAATYRLGYQVAFGTPTFPAARFFHVKDFGAVGDGVTDDFSKGSTLEMGAGNQRDGVDFRKTVEFDKTSVVSWLE